MNEELNEYEKERQEKIRKNKALLSQLGLDGHVVEIKPSRKVKDQDPQEPTLPTRRSVRIALKEEEKNKQNIIFKSKKGEEDEGLEPQKKRRKLDMSTKKRSKKKKSSSSTSDDSNDAITENHIEAFFDPLQESLRILRREKKMKRRQGGHDVSSEDDLLAAFAGFGDADDNSSEDDDTPDSPPDRSSSGSLKPPRNGHMEEEEDYFEFVPAPSLNDYEPEKNNVTSIIDSKVCLGDYLYYVQRADGSKEWIHYLYLCNYVQLICHYIASKVTYVDEEPQESSKKENTLPKVHPQESPKEISPKSLTKENTPLKVLPQEPPKEIPPESPLKGSPIGPPKDFTLVPPKEFPPEQLKKNTKEFTVGSGDSKGHKKIEESQKKNTKNLEKSVTEEKTGDVLGNKVPEIVIGRRGKKKLKYHIKWKDLDKSHNSWIPENELVSINSQQLIKEYEERQAKELEEKQKNPRKKKRRKKKTDSSDEKPQLTRFWEQFE